MVLEETAQVVAAYWSSTGRQLPTGAPPPNGEASRTASVPARANGRLPAVANGRPADGPDGAAPGRARSAMRRRPSRGRHERR